MTASSQNSQGPRPRRPWTTQDQLFAQVASACGVTTAEIARCLRRGEATVRRRLIPKAHAAHLEVCKRYRETNRQKHRDTCRRYRELFPEVVRESQDRFHAQNPDAKRRYYFNHRTARLRQQREYRQANADKLKKWRAANADRRAAWRKNWGERNKEWVREYARLNADRIRARRRECYRRNAEVYRDIARRYAYKKRAAGRRALDTCTLFQQNLRFSLFRNQCAYCGSSNRLEADHVVALSKGGLHTASNIVPACKCCNASKRDRPVEQWYRSQIFFSEVRWAKVLRHCPEVSSGQLPLTF